MVATLGHRSAGRQDPGSGWEGVGAPGIGPALGGSASLPPPPLAFTRETSGLRRRSSGKTSRGRRRQALPGAAGTVPAGSPGPILLPRAAGQDGAAGGREGLRSRPLQELLLLPVRLDQLRGHQLHQLQALLDLHQDLKVLPAPHLRTERWTLCPGACGHRPAPAPQRGEAPLLSRGSPAPRGPGVPRPYFPLPGSRSGGVWWVGLLSAQTTPTASYP